MVESTENKILYKIGTSPVFAFPVRFISPDDVACYINVNGTERKLDSAEYSVERKEDYSDGANVTLNIDPLPTGATLAIVRECAIVQTVAFPISGKFPASSNEEALDRLTMICQELAEKIGRSASVGVTDVRLNPNDLLDQITQAVADSQEAKRLVEQFLNTFSKLTVGSDGKLYWDGCEIVTKCNLKSVLNELGIDFDGSGSGGGDSGGGGGGNNNDDVDPPFDDDEDDEDDTGGGGKPGDNVGGTVTGDTSRGYIAVAGTNRTLSINISPWSGSTDEETCTTTDYFAGIYSNTAEERFFEKLRTVVGEIEEGEDGTECIPWLDPMPWGCEDGELYFYRDEEPVYPSYDPDAAAEGMSEIAAQIIEGDIHDKVVGIPGGGPYPAGEWDGYKWYGRPGGFGDWGITCHNQGDLISGSYGVSVDWYNAWGESPCDDGSSLVGTTYSIHVFTMKFSWIPGDDYSGARPKKVIIGHPDGTRRAYEFDVEYCLEGHPSNWAHPEWAKVVPCGSHCRWPMFQAIRDKMPDVDYSDGNFTEGDFYYPAIEETPEYTYEGVIFEGEEEV